MSLNKFLYPFFFLLLFSPLFAECDPTLSTYFEYSSQEVQQLKDQESNLSFGRMDLNKWDGQVRQALKGQLESLSAIRLYTYLYVAQSEVSKLSYQVKGKFAGSLDPISFRVISLFVPEYRKPTDYQEDKYSIGLAKVVMEKIHKRMEQEDTRQVQFQIPENMKDTYYVGVTVAKWLPWYTIPATAFWPLPPPSPKDPSWKEQIKKIRNQKTPMTEEKKDAILLWAGMTDPEGSDWRMITNNYLFTNDVPIFKMLQVRSLLMMGLYDACLVSFNSKYYYLVTRPSAYDPSLHHEIPVPKHPSYPSNHSITAALSAAILSYFFPKESDYWYRLENESGMSRIWAGIHYPIDDLAGRAAGKKIADNLLKQVNACH